MAANSDVSSVVRPEFPPGLAPKMLEMKKALDKLQTSLNPLLQKPHHEILAKVSCEIFT